MKKSGTYVCHVALACQALCAAVLFGGDLVFPVLWVLFVALSVEQIPNLDKKTKTQAWQLVFHTGNTVAGWYSWSQVFDPATLTDMEMIPEPRIYQMYSTQTAVWLFTAFSHVFLECDRDRKDDLQMLVHHVVTIGLILLSHCSGFGRIGAVIMLLHDASDIPADIVKITHYLGFENLCACCFGLLLAVWGYLRLYVFPYYVIYQGAVVAGSDSACSGDNMLACYLVRPLSIGLLLVLFYLNALWYFLFIRILVKIVQDVPQEKIATEEYETDQKQKAGC